MTIWLEYLTVSHLSLLFLPNSNVFDITVGHLSSLFLQNCNVFTLTTVGHLSLFLSVSTNIFVFACRHFIGRESLRTETPLLIKEGQLKKCKLGGKLNTVQWKKYTFSIFSDSIHYSKKYDSQVPIIASFVDSMFNSV